MDKYNAFCVAVYLNKKYSYYLFDEASNLIEVYPYYKLIQTWFDDNTDIVIHVLEPMWKEICEYSSFTLEELIKKVEYFDGIDLWLKNQIKV